MTTKTKSVGRPPNPETVSALKQRVSDLEQTAVFHERMFRALCKAFGHDYEWMVRWAKDLEDEHAPNK